MIRTKLALFALTALLNAQTSMDADKAQTSNRESSRGKQLAGAWIIAVVPDVPPGAPSSTNYVLTIYGSDGSVIVAGTPATSGAPAIQALGNQLGGGAGEWVSLGNGQFMGTHLALIFKDGVPGGFQRVRTTITLDETLNAYTATAVSDFLDLKGNVVLTGTSKSTGTRMTWH